jgi:hypothetical protein
MANSVERQSQEVPTTQAAETDQTYSASKELKLLNIVKAIRDLKQSAAPILAQSAIKDLFEIVPDLECIPKEVRVPVDAKTRA